MIKRAKRKLDDEGEEIDSGLLTLALIVIPAKAGILKKAGEEKMDDEGEEIDVGLLASTPSGRYASKTPAGVLSN